jgi:hypothetical protein
LNSQSSCLYPLRAGIAGVCHYAWLFKHFKILQPGYAEDSLESLVENTDSHALLLGFLDSGSLSWSSGVRILTICEADGKPGGSETGNPRNTTEENIVPRI